MGRPTAAPLGGAVLAALWTGLSPQGAGSHADPVSDTSHRVMHASGAVVLRGRR